MELKQSSTVDQRSDVYIVRKIVEMVTGTSIMAKDRKRNTVESRMIYATLLREQGYALTYIGDTLGKDHTTILHYLRSLKALTDTDVNTMRKYLRCRELYLIEKQPVNLTQNIDYKTECAKLTTQIDIAKAENYLLTEEIAKLKKSEESRLLKLFKLIEENTPKGNELIVERKIRKMFDV
jgi:Bacterial dnaA protein helix-turn-helix